MAFDSGNNGVSDSLSSNGPTREDCETCSDSSDQLSSNDGKEELVLWNIPASLNDGTLCPIPNVAISYSIESGWMLQSTWFMQELLTTFNQEINSVSLCPVHDDEEEAFVSPT